MNQPSLDFSASPARSRNSDPESSHAAAGIVTRSGRASRQRARAFALVCESPGLTSAELAERHHEDRQMLARRLPELRDRECKLVRNGEQRICSVNKTLAITWWPT